MDDFGSQSVELHIYDMTQGMASMMSPILLGKRELIVKIFSTIIIFSSIKSALGRQIDGVWHTAVVVFGREYFFGSQGITSCTPVNMTSHSLTARR